VRLNRFVDILCEHVLEFGAFSYTREKQPGMFRGIYETALNRVFINAASLCERLGERGRVVFAQTHEISEKLIGRYFERLGWSQYLDGYAVEHARCNPALQAAEIVARGMKRLMQDGGITYSLARILLAANAPEKEIRYWPPEPFEAVRQRVLSPHLLAAAQHAR
jgi:hypothetical protein